MYQLGIDIGGTFTDFIMCHDGQVKTLKIPSNKENPLNIVLKGLNEFSSQLSLSLEEFVPKISRFVHGNTVAVNALIQKKGVKTGLICTRGFRDALEIRRSQLDNQWDFFAPIPAPLVPRYLRFELSERIDYSGKILEGLSYEDLDEIVLQVKEQDVKALAVCLLFSFINPHHEKKVKEYLSEKLPEVFITISSEVAPKLGEYERTSTTVLNAYITPLVSNYLDELISILKNKGLRCKVKLVQNNGGLTDVSIGREFGVKSLFSGPAAGTSGAYSLSHKKDEKNIILIDMGGTSFDVSIIEENRIKIIPESKVEGHPINLPLADIHSIGIGGGSISFLDGSKRLNVGPISAEAYPGPACYNRGGERATITDAMMVLGYIQEENFGAGTINAKRQLAITAIEEKIAVPLNITVEEAAYAIYEIALQKMVDAVHLMTIQKGSDPRDFSLCAIGGAAPVFASNIAQELGIKKVIIPAFGEIFCAQGMLEALTRVDITRSFIQPFIKENILIINSVLEALKKRGIEDMAVQGVPLKNISYTYYLELRYEDQHHELSLDFNREKFDEDTLEELIERFHQMHEEVYGYKEQGQNCTLVHIRLELNEERLEESFSYKSHIKIDSDKFDTRSIIYDSLKKANVPVYKEDQLAGKTLSGPALIEKKYTTVFLPPKVKVQVDSFNNIILN